MKKDSLSLHKSFLTNLTFLKGGVKLQQIPVVRPGEAISLVQKPQLKQKTDRGNQLVTLSNYKKCLLNDKIETNSRLDLILFYLKFSSSLTESHNLIKQGYTYVNGVRITNTNHKLTPFSIISLTKGVVGYPEAYIKHEISNTLPSQLGENLSVSSKAQGIFYNKTAIVLPKLINMEIMRRMKKSKN